LSAGEETRADLAIEVATIRSNGHSASLQEAAIELVEGSPAGLFDVAHALFPDGGLRFSRLSEAARGYRLAEAGDIEPPLAPRYACEVTLDPAQTVEQTARDLVRECFDQIAANILVVRQLDDPEGPHQLRVGLRRLRSAFSVFAPVLQSPELMRLNEEARWLSQELGRLRDLDVVANDLVRRESAAHPDEPGLPGLADALSREAAEVRDAVRKRLTEPQAQAFLIDLVRFVEMRGWFAPQDFGQTERLAAPAAQLAETALDRHWKKVRKRARGLEGLDAAHRHELRKQAKKLRYAVEFFSPLYPAKRVEPFVKRLKALQAIFGDLNDAATAKAMFTGTTLDSACAPSMQRAIGWVIGTSQLRAQNRWVDAKALWQDLHKTPPFWR
jgi:CHAD domain-containing protein